METNAVNYEIENNIGIIKGSNPPVNALSYEVRKGLINCLAILLENKDVKGIIFDWRRTNLFRWCRHK